VTHKPNFLPLVQRIIVVDKGRIVIDGPRDDVLNRLRQAAVQQQQQQQQQQQPHPANVAQSASATPQTVTLSS